MGLEASVLLHLVGTEWIWRPPCMSPLLSSTTVFSSNEVLARSNKICRLYGLITCLDYGGNLSSLQFMLSYNDLHGFG